MSDNAIYPQTVKNISRQNLAFRVPPYQRGFRWKETQVRDLLDDVNNFQPSDDGGYLLQPLVVTKRDTDSTYEVVDGQQRLTTIHLLLLFLNQYIHSIEPAFSLQYETRAKANNFLHELQNQGIEVPSHTIDRDAAWQKLISHHTYEIDSIDAYHLFVAWYTIAQWYHNQTSFDAKKFYQKIRSAYFLWYELTTPEEAQNAFFRLNSGQISLAEAELIKALYFRAEDKGPRPNSLSDERKHEIADDWENFEATLQNDSYWYFIGSQHTKTEPRLGILLRHVAQNQPGKDENQSTFDNQIDAFRIFEHNSDNLSNLWEQVREGFHAMVDWYNKLELYHRVGFLVINFNDYRFSDLLQEYKRKKTKDEFLQYLNNKIRSKLNQQTTKAPHLENLEYGQDDDRIKLILLLFNILETEGANERFPFEEWSCNKWSLEHIHAKNEEDIDELSDMGDYLEGLNNYLNAFQEVTPHIYDEIANLLAEIQSIKTPYIHLSQRFRSVIQKVQNTHAITMGSDNIENLALLIDWQNTSLGNKFFPQKRQELIQHLEENNWFIPKATLQVFLKYYSIRQLEPFKLNLYEWNQEDRDNYVQRIKETLRYYLGLPMKQ